uniref:Coenzyme PQQ synthesis protein F-like C-terminal lobe domain-containing protein n=2 Tax=Leptocylindrus danicus TaxID=163516 RepID=A0A7S2PDI3_9STRA|mmetsp:Transcript_30129/g.44278  ORF Transcript_30129/g.44278 Transcript_30129/m.44278 type:complete len:321 (+) Transcript_30129:110-1072(+)
MDLCMEVNKFSMFDKIEAISQLTTSDLKAFSKRLLSRVFVEILVHGNSSPSEARNIATTIVDGLASRVPFASTVPTPRVVQLKDRVEYVHRFAGFNPNNPNNVLQTLFQIGITDLKNNSVLALLSHLVQEPAFDELRTQEQLGYIVHTSVKTNGPNIKSLMFLIQSDSYEPQHLNDRVEAFISRFRERLVAMGEEEFQSNTSAVVEEFLEKNKNLAEESSKYWNVINNKSYLFRRFQLLAAEIEKLSKAQILQFFDRYIAKDGVERKKISVQVFGSNHLEKMGEEVVDAVVIPNDNTVDFKQGMSLFPLPPSVDVTGMKL